VKERIMKKIALIAVFILSACGTPSQDAQIEIFPAVTASNIGNGVALSITVDDARPTGVIGAVDEDSQLVTSQDLAELIGLALVDAYTKQGFNVTAANNPGAVRMVVSLEDLSYTKDGALVTTTVATKSRVTVNINDKGYSNTYSNSEDRTVPFSANEATNNSILRSILERMVERIANDANLLGVLTR